MKHFLCTSLAVIAAAAMLPAQLVPGNYLVGTQGWDDNDLPDPTKDTVQLVSPYTGNATTLNVTGVPKGESPAAFVIEHPASFLMGTKVAAAPAQGNVYRVALQRDGSWKASKLNTSDLNINVSAMLPDSAYVYIIGSAEFGTGAKDAQALKVARSSGAVTMIKQFGANFMTNGANGSASGLVMIGTTLHVFTFNSSDADTRNEHWAVTTGSSPTATKVGGDLPVSKRFTGRGFASTAAVLDPASSNIIVVGRWGEVLWRTADGKDVGYEQWPGELDFTQNYATELPRNIAINTDTGALAMGDHDDASIDERRCTGQLYPHFAGGPYSPFLNNVCKPNRPSTGTYTVAALEYIPTYARYLPIGDGCKESATGGAPASYISSPPTVGTENFAITLSTMASSAALAVGEMGAAPFDFGPLGAPDCKVFLDKVYFYSSFTVSGGTATATFGGPKHKVPATAKGVTIYTQWVVPDRAANALGIALSEARKVVIP